MRKIDLTTIDIRTLNEKAQKFFETSDRFAIRDLFGSCETIEKINEVAEEMYDEIFDDMEDDNGEE